MPALDSNLVESVVDPRRPEISPEQLLREVADQRQGADAARDGGAKGAVGSPVGIDVDPLVLAGGLGERGDAVLVDDGSLVPSSSPSARFAPSADPKTRTVGALDVDELGGEVAHLVGVRGVGIEPGVIADASG